MELPRLTKTEQSDLLAAVQHNFGPCTCRPGVQCDGHRFLAETQVIGTERVEISRVQRMVMARREGQTWLTQEFGRPLTLEQPQPEEAPLPPDLIPGSPPQGDDASTLPW